MKIESSVKYRTIDFKLLFSQAITFYTFPPFIFRSVLGKELKKMACIMRSNRCEICSLRYTCAYSLIFETPIQKNNYVLPGRNKAGHPFVISSSLDKGDTAESMVLRMTVFGPAMEYFPYLYYAILRAGEKGLFKERISFSIEDVRSNGESVLTESGDVEVENGRAEWFLSISSSLSGKKSEANPEGYTDTSGGEKKVHVDLLSPLRVKVEGRYRRDFAADEFLKTMWSRVRIVCSLYGQWREEEDCTPPEGLKIVNKELGWRDLERWSSRQKTKMKMGGVMGGFTLAGPVNERLLSLLRFAEIFHIGKNTAFGLGKINANIE